MSATASGIYTERAHWYRLGRPGYPPGVFELLAAAIPPPARIGDIGAGSGILAAQLLDCGYEVVAVEPNDAMRALAVEAIGAHPRATVVAGTAERSGRPERSLDAICVAQAMHWFDLVAAREEFIRLLRPGGITLAAWNEMQLSRGSFGCALGALLDKFSLPTGRRLGARDPVELVRELLDGPVGGVARFDHEQALDEPALLGRVLSNSAAPPPGGERAIGLEAAIRLLFAEHEAGGVVRLAYETTAVLGSFAEDRGRADGS